MFSLDQRFAKVLLVVMAVLLVVSGGIAYSPKKAEASVSDLDLAYRWAPVHYQDTDSTDYDADYITAVDYDGDWDTLNNWEHQDDDGSRLKGTAYYSVSETSTHWFILYGFYHPRDWVDYPDFGLDTHENDMEGIVLSIRKDGSTYGSFEGMVTVFHSDFYSYTPSGSPYTNGGENIDGTVIMTSYDGVSRPTTFQEAKGHGIKNWNGNTGGDMVLYYPSKTTAEVPSGGNDRDVKYKLVDIFEANGLWDRRNNSETFASFGTFRGDNGYNDNSANAPWGWNDGDDGDVQRGEIATDPAKLFSIYFDGTGNFSTTYVNNPY